MWTDREDPTTPPQVEYQFVLPRILSNGEVTDVINTGIWHHIAFTRDVGEESISLYVDGQRYGRLFGNAIAESLDPTVESDYTLAFGGKGWGSGRDEDFLGDFTRGDQTLNGYMDDIRITRGIVYRGSSFDVPTEAHPYEDGTPPAETQSYTYAVTNEIGNYIFNGEGLIDVRDPDLTGGVGDTFVFNVNVTSGHPFWIKDTNTTGPGNATETWANLSGQGSTIGSVIATFYEPGTYYYICQSHSDMVGTITIS